MFVTGITKSIVSIPLFDLEDITDDIELHNIAGLTETDLDHFAKTSRISGKSNDIMTSELKQWYNGYNFSEFAPSSLHNPLSVLSYLKNGS